MPFSYDGDALLSLAAIKTMISDGWVFRGTQLGAPFGFNFLDFPGADNFFLVVLKMFTIFSSDHFLILNIFYIFGFALIYFATYWSLRKYEVNIFLSVAFAIAFTVAPYHFLRNAKHLFLATYFIVPIISAVMIDLTNGILKNSSGRFGKLTLSYFFILVLAGMCGIYYAFFSILIFSLLGIIGYLRYKDLAVIKNTVIGIFVILLAALSNLLPSLYYRLVEGPNLLVAQRSFIESELYGLKLIQLILPIWGHSSNLFASLNHRYQEQILITEATSSALGILASVGFFYLLISLIARLRPVLDERLQVLSRINLFAFLIGTVGGLGGIFAFFITPEFRGLNRISIFIAFFSLLALAIILDKILNAINSQYKKVYFLALSLCISVFALFDQVPKGVIGQNPELIKSFYVEKKFYKDLEDLVPPGSVIYQYPYVQFPESAELYKEGYYSYFKPYLQTIGISWSYGAIKGRPADFWNNAISTLDPNERVKSLRKSGFSGVLVNTDACKNGCIDMLQALKSVSRFDPLISPDGVNVFYPIQPARLPEITPKLSYIPADGFYGLESNRNGESWSWAGANAKLLVYNFSKDPVKAVFEARISVVNSSKLSIDNRSTLQEIAFIPNEEQRVTLEFQLAPGKNIIAFNTGMPPVEIKPDPRKFGFRLSSIRIVALD
ncbi:hypothetical protein ICN48_02170 [Polynucleobacter sp. JS-Safj-400b-B2]|uniref:hypothetical protein n=1 Tax=Polynucleobacter sp. JS-Safj-400b-B2 TaxID=2576921 RepID=UPI001C0B0D8E|nr:hypothetical protein [Polynucleobacter sp. JS-Safj-400b-B2]MBU3625047.1 hypothetical protein [Polynucleobacter sp. JS-Safj-400b-B2]